MKIPTASDMQASEAALAGKSLGGVFATNQKPNGPKQQGIGIK